MTNEEKLRETFPKTIFIFQKNGNDETTAIMCSDEWLRRDYDQMYKDSEPCEDVVSKANILQSFESYCENNCQYSKKQRDVMCGACMMGDAIEIVENLPPVTSKQRWIPVSERLPKEHTCGDEFIDPSEYVLVQMKSGCMKVSRYWGSRERYKDCPWIDLSYPTTDEVIAWMPLPEPWKGESE